MIRVSIAQERALHSIRADVRVLLTVLAVLSHAVRCKPARSDEWMRECRQVKRVCEFAAESGEATLRRSVTISGAVLLLRYLTAETTVTAKRNVDKGAQMLGAAVNAVTSMFACRWMREETAMLRLFSARAEAATSAFLLMKP